MACVPSPLHISIVTPLVKMPMSGTLVEWLIFASPSEQQEGKQLHVASHFISNIMCLINLPPQ